MEPSASSEPSTGRTRSDRENETFPDTTYSDRDKETYPGRGADLNTTEKQKKKYHKCMVNLDKALKKSPYVRYMMDHMYKAGCPVDPNIHIVCEPCSSKVRGGYDPLTRQVVLCQNNLPNVKIMKEVLTHELIHAYDDCRAHVDWNNLHHLACTEIRAANLSTECLFWKEFRRFHFGWKKHHQKCVKYRAMKSIQCVKDVTEDEAKKAVSDVFEQCFKDTIPFERIPP